jgi:outer membrane protein TolC
VKWNPQLDELTTQARQAGAAKRAAWGEYLPEVSLQASYGLRYRDTDGTADEYAVGLFLEVPIFSGGAIDGQVKRMAARQRQVEAAAGAFEDQLHVEVREALTSWRVAMAHAEFAAKSVDVNREALEAAMSLYAAGDATALDVLTSQNDLTRAEGALVQALGAYAIARAEVARITAGGASSVEATDD